MAALPYLQLYVADYLADTMHLKAEEHGAYLLLIMNYWQRGKPLQDCDERLAAVARVSNDRWVSVRASLVEYFEVVEGEWVHHRIESDLQRVRSQQKQRSEAGRKSAKSRAIKAKNTNRTTKKSTSVKSSLNEDRTNTDTDTDKDKDTDKRERGRARASRSISLKRFDTIREQWEDFILWVSSVTGRDVDTIPMMRSSIETNVATWTDSELLEAIEYRKRSGEYKPLRKLPQSSEDKHAGSVWVD